MSVATAEDHADSVEAFSGASRRSRGKFACTTERAASCDGCRIRPVSLCGALSEAGGDVVPPFKISERFFPADHAIFEQYEVGHEFCVIVCGWAVQFEVLEDGSRQILDFLLPGSMAGFQPDGAARSPYCVRALTDVRACTFSTAGFFDAAKSNPALALRLAALANQSNYRSLRRLTLIGRKAAKVRVATLLFELYRQVRRWWVSPRGRRNFVAAHAGAYRRRSRTHQRSCQSHAARASRGRGAGLERGGVTAPRPESPGRDCRRRRIRVRAPSLVGDVGPPQEST